MKMRIAEIFVVEEFRPAQIQVNVDRSFGSLTPIWQAFAQGGEEAAGVRMFEPTLDLMQQTSPKYIRIDHIYDDDYYGVLKEKGNYDWSKLDETVADILAMGAKPFFSLSYMPAVVAEGKIGKPPQWQDWQELVRATVAHYSRDIEEVYYEVWNEPSLEWFGGWKMYGEKDYRILYQQAVLGAGTALNQNPGLKAFKIGGPAIPIMDPTWVRLLFDFCQAENLRLDFVSWHRYNFDPDVFVRDVYEVNILKDQPKYSQFKDIELLITEWGPNSEKDTVYSSNVAAAHAVVVIRKLLDKTKWLFTFEVKDGPNQGQDAWGLLSHQLVEGGVKEKPRYFLYDWLSDFEGSRLEVLGEGTQITGFSSSDNRTVNLILANYKPGGGSEETFPITFQGMKDGEYRLFEQKLFGQPQEREVTITGGKLELTQSLQPYEVVRVRLSRIN